MKRKILDSGIWLQPIVFILVMYAFKVVFPSFLTLKHVLIIFAGSFLPTVFLLIYYIGAPRESEAFIGKEKAMYPPVDKAMLYKKPMGVVFGKYKGKYVCRPITADGHVFLIGGSGVGKSSTVVIPTLLSNPGTRIFAVDIKGELSYKTVKYGNKHVLIFNPQDRKSYGWNPFFNLKKSSSDQEILETTQVIVFSLISLGADMKDAFWKNSARNLLLGLMLYYYKAGTVNFIGIIDEILNKPVRDSIKAVMDNAKDNSIERRYITQFSSMEDETLGGIDADMRNHLVVFANDQDIRFAFKDNGRKIHPRLLEKGYSIYLAIREEKLTAYYDVLQLIINQTLAELEKRPEDSKPIIFIIDELPRILSAGKIDRLLDAARTLRSRKVVLFLVAQSTEALMDAFTENQVADLISNCAYNVVLSASTRKTQDMVCRWCGKYKVRKQSWNLNGSDRRVSVSFEEKDIVEPSDLKMLDKAGEAILISPWGYNRIKKCPYYKDKIMGPKSQEIVKYNKTILQMETETKRCGNKSRSAQGKKTKSSK